MAEKSFDSTLLHQAIGNVVPAFMPDDRRFFDTIYESMIRVVDDMLLEAQFTNASKAVTTVLPWLTKTLWTINPTWVSTGARHRHRSVSRDVSGLTSVYFGETYDLQALDVFLRGMQLDDPGKSPDYVVTNTPDAQQILGLQPRGTRVVFDFAPLAGSLLDLMADRVLETTILTTTDVVNLPLTGGRDGLATRVVVEALDITDDVTLTPSGLLTVVSWAEARSFKAGSVVRVIDDVGAVVHEVAVPTTVASISVPLVDADSRVELIVEVALSAFSLDGNRVRVTGTTVPPDISLVVRDSNGQEVVTPSANRAYFPLSRAFDPDTTEILFVGVDVLHPYVVSDEELRFTRPFDVGVRARVEIPIEQEHRHEHQRVTRVTVGTTVVLPDGTRPIVFDGVVHDPAYPVQVFVNDALLHAEDYSIATPLSIETIDTFPVGTVFDVYYVRAESPIRHRHVRTRKVTIAAEQTFPLGHVQDEQAFRVVFDGVNIASADPVIDVSSDRTQVVSRSVAPQGTVVRTRTTEFRRDYEHALTGNDALIVSADQMQDGIAPFDEELVPGGYTTQMEFGDGFDIVEAVLSSDEPLDPVWIVMARFDLETGWDNFGRLVRFRRDNTVDYLNRLQAIVATYTSARTRYSLENAAAILLGSALALRAGVPNGIVSSVDGTERTLTVRHDDRTTSEVALHPTIPDRIDATVPRDHAVSEYAKIVELPTVEALPELARDLSPDYRPGKIMDQFEAGEVRRVPDVAIVLDAVGLTFEDFEVDFIEEQVRPGDRIVLDYGADPFISTILRVEAHRVYFSDVPVPTLTGYSSGGYSSGGYSGVTLPTSLVAYTIFVRRRRRHDEVFFLDELPEPSRQEAVTALSRVFSAFFRVLEIRWEAMNAEGQRDLGVFLDRAAPSYVKIQPVVRTRGGLDLADTAQFTSPDEVVLEDSLDFLYVGVTTIAAHESDLGVANGFIE